MKLIKKFNEFTNIVDEEKSYIMIKDRNYHIEIANPDFILVSGRIESQHVLTSNIKIEVESTITGIRKSLTIHEGDENYIRLISLNYLSSVTEIKPNNKNTDLLKFYNNINK